MSTNHKSRIPEILKKYEPQLLAEWVDEQKANLRRNAVVKDSELRDWRSRTPGR